MAGQDSELLAEGGAEMAEVVVAQHQSGFGHAVAAQQLTGVFHPVLLEQGVDA